MGAKISLIARPGTTLAAIAAAALLLGGCSGRDQELAENAARAEAAAKRAEDAAARAEAAAKKAGAEPAPAVVEAEPEVLDTEPDNAVPEQPADDPAPTTQG